MTNTAIETAEISAELAAGIAAYDARIRALGGYGTRITATMPDGTRRTGTLVEAGFGGCQPTLVDDGGRRFRIIDLST